MNYFFFFAVALMLLTRCQTTKLVVDPFNNTRWQVVRMGDSRIDSILDKSSKIYVLQFQNGRYSLIDDLMEKYQIQTGNKILLRARPTKVTMTYQSSPVGLTIVTEQKHIKGCSGGRNYTEFTYILSGDELQLCSDKTLMIFKKLD